MSRIASRKQSTSVEVRRQLSRVLYGLSERRVRRNGPAGGIFQRLLTGGPESLDADESWEGAPRLTQVPELLGDSGWHRLGCCLSGGVYRVVIAQRAGAHHERLTARELAVAELMAAGWKSRRAGLELGIAAPTVRGALERCLFKLELASPIQLPLLWHALRSPGRAFEARSGAVYLVFQVSFEALVEPLTNAERSLVERSLEGDSYRGIAAHRGVSVRTVATQLARLFEKVGVSSRVELLVRLIELAEAREALEARGTLEGPAPR